MHQTSWVHRHLQACNFVFDPGWRRLHRQWCIYQLFAGRFQDDEAYHKWRVHLWRRRAVRVRRRRRRDDVTDVAISDCSVALRGGGLSCGEYRLKALDGPKVALDKQSSEVLIAWARKNKRWRGPGLFEGDLVPRVAN